MSRPHRAPHRNRYSKSITDSHLEISDESLEEISDERLSKLINVALKGRKEEDIIWITSEYIRFKKNSENWKSIDIQTIRDIREFSNFNELKNILPSLLKKLKSEEKIIEFLEIVQNSKIEELPSLIIELKNEDRICNFLLNYINTNYIKFNFIYEKNAYLNIIHWYVTERQGPARRLNKIEKAINIFNTEIKINGKNHVKKLENQFFSEWVLQYLRKTDDYFMDINFIDTNNLKRLKFITAYLDWRLHHDNVFYENLMNKINKAWSQKKFRDGNKVKKPYHIPLTKKAREELRDLSNFKELSEAVILEGLIHQMFLKEMCDEKGNSKY